MKQSVLAVMAGLAMFSGLAPVSEIARAQSVVTYHNSPSRSGDYIVPGLTEAAAATLHKDSNFSAAVSGNVYAQPLYWKPSGATVGLLIVATESNLVYALNADTGAQVWTTQLATPASRSALPCGDIDPEGVTGTPVIDPASGVVYLDAMTSGPGAALRHMIYALSLTTGKIVPQWPVDVDAAMTARHQEFYSDIQGERSALQFFKGKLYVNYAGRGGDCGAHGAIYHGTVIEFTTAPKPAISGSWQTRAGGGGIWSQGGVASDGTSLFTTTGNTFGANTWGDGEAIIRLRPGLSHSANRKDFFTPGNWKTLDNEDADLGGTMALPITVPTAASGKAARIMGFGKDGHAYLIDAASMGGIRNQVVSNAGIVTAPAVYNAAAATLVAFTNRNGLSSSCSGGNLTMLKVSEVAKDPIAIDWCKPLSGAGAPIVTTTNGNANPVIWVTGAEGDNLLHGFNALSGKPVFTGGGISMTGLHRFSTIVAANRHLYIGADGTVYAFTF